MPKTTTKTKGIILPGGDQAVRAFLAGTLRSFVVPIAPQPPDGYGTDPDEPGHGSPPYLFVHSKAGAGREGIVARCPFRVGETRWLKEAWRAWERDPDGLDHIWYRADDFKRKIPNTTYAGDFVVGRFSDWHPASTMPRWASRFTLTITSVKPVRVSEMSEGEIQSCGIERLELSPSPYFSEHHGIKMYGHPLTSTYGAAFQKWFTTTFPRHDFATAWGWLVSVSKGEKP